MIQHTMFPTSVLPRAMIKVTLRHEPSVSSFLVERLTTLASPTGDAAARAARAAIKAAVFMLKECE